MQARFIKWCGELIEVQNDNNYIKKAAWLFSFKELIHQKTNFEIPSPFLLDCLDFLKNDNVDQLKKLFIQHLEAYSNDPFAPIPFSDREIAVSLLRGSNLDEVKNLINNCDISNEIQDFHTQLLTTTRDYCLAKKTLMRYFHDNKNRSDHIEEDIEKILNEKFNFNLKSEQNKDAFNQLKSEIHDLVTKKRGIEIHHKIERIIQAIRTGSTARGTSPYGGGSIKPWYFDFWGLGERLLKKSEENKLGIFKGKLTQGYSGADNIKTGLDFIQSKVNVILSKTELDIVLAIIEDFVKEKLLKQDQVTNIPDAILFEINANLNMMTGDVNGAMLKALKSILSGYSALSKMIDNTNNPSTANKIIELLILQEILLLTKQLLQKNGEETVNLLYRSCVDLLSLIIVLKLGTQETKNRIMTNDLFVFPKDMTSKGKGQDYAFETSKMLVGKKGQDAMEKGLKILGFSKYNEVNGIMVPVKLPGFTLPTILSKNGFSDKTYDIAVYWEVGGKREEAIKVDQGHAVACVGRISETIFNIEAKDLELLTDDVLKWCEWNKEPNILCVDLTLRKENDEMVEWLKSEKIQQLIKNNKLNILFWQSEQKQQSLGTGKYSAGSVYLLSGNHNLIEKFNLAAEQSFQDAPDNNLASFFRVYCTDAMHQVVAAQIRSAEIVAAEINRTCVFGPKDECHAMANGPFVTILFPNSIQLKHDTFNLIKQYWPSTDSFGFSSTTIATWDGGRYFIRVSIGLESQEKLLEDLKNMAAKPNLAPGFKS